MRILFAGTPEFAAISLAGLVASRHEVVGVLTQPDRPAGRGRRVRASPVKEMAITAGLRCLQPEALKSPALLEALAAWRPELMVVVAYGLLLPPAVLELPPRGCINVHASLLPRWRGSAPIQRAILAGDAETGVSIMQMDAGLDTGPVYLRSRCPIASTDNAGSLHDRLAGLGRDALLETLDGLEDQGMAAQPQDDGLATRAPKIVKSEARVDWSRSATEIHRQVRAFNPWPVAYSHLDGGLVRIWESEPGDEAANAAPGTIVKGGAAGLVVATGDGGLRITRLQLAGGRPLTAREYLNAHADVVGRRLGEARV